MPPRVMVTLSSVDTPRLLLPLMVIRLAPTFRPMLGLDHGGAEAKVPLLPLSAFVQLIVPITWALFVPPTVVLLMSFCWGLGGGLFLNLGRTLFLEATPQSHRGRCLSVYMLALLGMAPIGTQLSGWTGAALGAATGCTLAGLAMMTLLAICFVATPVRTFD